MKVKEGEKSCDLMTLGHLSKPTFKALITSSVHSWVTSSVFCFATFGYAIYFA